MILKLFLFGSNIFTIKIQIILSKISKNLIEAELKRKDTVMEYIDSFATLGDKKRRFANLESVKTISEHTNGAGLDSLRQFESVTGDSAEINRELEGMEDESQNDKFDARGVFSNIKYTESVNMRIDDYRKTSNYQKLVAEEIFKEEAKVPVIPDSVIRPKKPRETYKQVIAEAEGEDEEGPDVGSRANDKAISGLIGVNSKVGNKVETSESVDQSERSNARLMPGVKVQINEENQNQSIKGRRSVYENKDFGLMEIVNGTNDSRESSKRESEREVSASSSNRDIHASNAVSEDMMVQNAIETEFGLVKVEGGVAMVNENKQAEVSENLENKKAPTNSTDPVEVIMENEEVFLRKKNTPRRETIENKLESRDFGGEVNTTLIQLAKDLGGNIEESPSKKQSQSDTKNLNEQQSNVAKQSGTEGQTGNYTNLSQKTNKDDQTQLATKPKEMQNLEKQNNQTPQSNIYIL